jgi:diguanylate cyclase (GGDEF)-like protein
VALQIAHTFKSPAEFDGTSRHDTLTGLPNLKQLEQFLDSTGGKHVVQESPFTLLFINVVGLEHINTTHGRTVGDEALLHVVRHATAGLRLADILFRYGSDAFVALLNDTNPELAKFAAGRIREGIRTNPLAVRGRSIQIDVLRRQSRPRAAGDPSSPYRDRPFAHGRREHRSRKSFEVLTLGQAKTLSYRFPVGHPPSVFLNLNSDSCTEAQPACRIL